MPLQFSDVTPQFPLAGKKDDDIVLRIRKMLDLALRADTPKHEAIHAMRAAQKVMAKHNLTQVKVMLETDEKQEVDTNLFFVRVRTDKGKNPTFWRWMSDVAGSISKAFGCRSCNHSYDIRFSFFGVSASSEAASATFVRYCAHIDARMISHIPPQHSEYSGIERATYLRKERIAFCNGMVAGLCAAYREDRQGEVLRATRLREYLDLYDKLQREPDDIYESVLNDLARELGIERGNRIDASQQLVLSTTAVTVAKDAEVAVMRKMGWAKFKTGKGRSRSGTYSSSYSQGYREGKRLKTAEEDRHKYIQ